MKKIRFSKLLALILAAMLLLGFAGCGMPKEPDPEEVLADLLPQANPLKQDISIKAGEEIPTVDAFLKSGYEGSFVTDVSAIDTMIAGSYDVEISVDGTTYTALLTIEDNAAPTGETQSLQVKTGAQIAAQDFFLVMEDDTGASAEFVNAPDTSVGGVYDVALKLVDPSGNETQFTEKLVVSDLDPITMEAQAEDFTAEQLFPGAADAIILENAASDQIGTTLIKVQLGGKDCYTNLTVKDTVAPTGEGMDKAHYTNDPLSADKLVANASDATQITYSYKTEPDFTKEGMQTVTVVMTDAAGNTKEVQSTITLSPDTEAPVIYGLQDHVYFYKGGPISYLATVYAEDNATASEDIVIEVDKSKVDIYNLGEYEVTYTASDANGNQSQKNVIVELIEPTVSQAELDAKVAEVLAGITTEDMSIGEKAFAVYNYIRDNMVYVNHSNKNDYVGEAYNGLVDLRGDCFTFYASTDALMRGIGADTIKVSRKYNTTRPTNHYWLKVNLGTGWYHVDTCNTGPRNFEAFMRTDDEFTTRARTFWMFDRSLYPASPTTPFEKDF